MHAENPNLYRRRLPALALALAYPWLRLFLILIRKSPAASAPVTVFQSYQVGDFYMALPALRFLAARIPLRVLCRPDCLFLVRELGAEAIPFENPFSIRPGPGTFLSGLRQALALRGRLGPIALDFHADPRTAFLLKAAGARTVRSFRRPYGWFIDGAFPIPAEALHQSEKDLAVARIFLEREGLSRAGIAQDTGAGDAISKAESHSLILSCWTRKDEKNWPLESWDVLIESLLGEGRPLKVIVPPDGDAAFAAFRLRWRDHIEFLETGLEALHALVRDAGGVLCTDNFLGHLGAYLGKPVFWINGSSEPEHVHPYGPATEVVQTEPMPCRPCRHRCTNPVYKQCLLELRPEPVAERARAWLVRNGL